jgi:tetratricopeptide (TPR) repeat protein
MSRNPGFVSAVFVTLALALSPRLFIAQQSNSSSSPSAAPAMTTEKALELAQQGHCQEALPALKRTVSAQGVTADMRKQAGVAGVRCSLAVDNRDLTAEFIRLLDKQFPHDPDVLFIVVHAYSDLSSRAAEELARTNPNSLPAHKLNAEAFEMQGNWSEAEREYQQMIAKYPNEPSLHFLLGRVLLSKPGADAATMDRAKQEFQKELEIDPKNAGAHYVLGELARRADNCEGAVSEFSEAAKVDPSLAEAYYGWGYCLVTLKKYQEAIPPLRAAERLTPGNPMVHYNLATALNLTGQKEEAQKEFAIHRDLTNAQPATHQQQPQ